MHVETLRHLGVGVAGDHPFRVVELVPVRVGGLDVHEEDVLGLRIQTGDFHLERWKDPSRTEKGVCIPRRLCASYRPLLVIT